MAENRILHDVPSSRTFKKAVICGIVISTGLILSVNHHTVYRFHELVSDYRFRIEKKFRHVQRRAKSGPKADKELKMVWQVSYPFTGSEVGMGILQDYTGFSMGTNYGDLMETDRGVIARTWNSIPIYPNRPNGPFKNRLEKPLPESGNVLVRTHCSGFCIDYGRDDCMFKHYVIPLTNPSYFFKSCASGKRLLPGKRITPVQYDQWRVEKVMVLIRDPVDIVRARFLNDMKLNPNSYPVNRKGVQAWCADYDGRQGSKNLKHYYNPETTKLLATDGDDVICKAELWRIARFYNQVFKVANFLDEDVLPVYFEDYGTDAEGTIAEMMDFLNYEQTETVDHDPFHQSGDDYIYFTKKQRKIMMKFIKAEASAETKEMFQRYF